MATKSVSYKTKVKIALRTLGGEALEDIAADTGHDPDDIASWAASFVAGGTERIRQDFPPRSQQPAFPRPDPSISTIGDALAYAEPKLGQSTYGGYFSNALAIVLANALRAAGFTGVFPDERGGFESPARGARGLKKLDVDYSTPEMGLSLGLSIKTITSRDPGTKRYTKNYSRNDNELRAEAVDYHRRQPFAVRVSSFGAAVKYFRYRTPRTGHDDEADLFEAFYVVAYEPSGDALFWPVHDLGLPPPATRRPHDSEAVGLEQSVEQVVAIYERRNDPPFEWAKQ